MLRSKKTVTFHGFDTFEISSDRRATCDTLDGHPAGADLTFGVINTQSKVSYLYYRNPPSTKLKEPPTLFSGPTILAHAPALKPVT